MKFSIKIETDALRKLANETVEKRRRIVPADSCSHPAFQNALTVVGEIIRNASLGLRKNKKACSEHGFLSLLDEKGIDLDIFIEEIIFANRTTFHVSCSDTHLRLRINVIKKGVKILNITLYFTLSNGEFDSMQYKFF